MSKIRINDLARELEVKSKSILDVLPEIGVTEKKSHSSSLEDHEAEKVRAQFRAASQAQSSSRSSRLGRPGAGRNQAGFHTRAVKRQSAASEGTEHSTRSSAEVCGSDFNAKTNFFSSCAAGSTAARGFGISSSFVGPRRSATGGCCTRGANRDLRCSGSDTPASLCAPTSNPDDGRPAGSAGCACTTASAAAENDRAPDRTASGI